ncbi:OLC1v1034713C3 [Oldenlandia corymbosa var. corymbosa]|uniref:OLC1v1034713C3 n=1 Tax=Oldenlandia corymbosa var. corymbosa TaxID=529605 RepID=A0AAV1CUC0_OLDCO|nr:OLC1v1034713C3 [Oldenlandia corymbosa var. corymbosa]
MQIRRRGKRCRPDLLILLCSILLIWIPEFIAAGTVTLASIEIFKTHEMLNLKPTVYFKCKGENMTTLPDVTEKHVVYNFKGEESWQPLTELLEKKCKRCGIYEHDKIASDDVFDEWELCASDFTDGKYNHVKEGEFNATFLCSDCVPSENGERPVIIALSCCPLGLHSFFWIRDVFLR